MPPPKKLENMPELSQFDLGWAIGFFEGEGSFNIHKNRPILQINNTDLSMLERFKTITGCGAIYPMKPNKLSKKQLWSWKTNTVAEAQYLTNLMYSGLSPRRKIMADKVLALKPQRAKMIRGGKCLNGHDLTPENIEEHPRNNSFACKICVNAKRRDRYALKKAQRDAILAP